LPIDLPLVRSVIAVLVLQWPPPAGASPYNGLGFPDLPGLALIDMAVGVSNASALYGMMPHRLEIILTY